MKTKTQTGMSQKMTEICMYPNDECYTCPNRKECEAKQDGKERHS